MLKCHFSNLFTGRSDADENQIDKCLDISSCFQSEDHIFNNADCQVLWTNFTEERDVYGERFSCTKWTREVENHTCHTECMLCLLVCFVNKNSASLFASVVVSQNSGPGSIPNNGRFPVSERYNTRLHTISTEYV